MLVTAASVSDSAYRTTVIDGAAALGIDVEVITRDLATRGFTPLPRRWLAERTLGWLMLHRRLVRDYEALPARSEAMIQIAMIDLMTRRLTGENPPGAAPEPRSDRTKRPLSHTGGSADPVSQAGEFTGDPAISPQWVLPSHQKDQRSH